MRKWLKTVALLTVLCIGCMLLAGCGEKEESKEQEKDAPLAGEWTVKLIKAAATNGEVRMSREMEYLKDSSAVLLTESGYMYWIGFSFSGLCPGNFISTSDPYYTENGKIIQGKKVEEPLAAEVASDGEDTPGTGEEMNYAVKGDKLTLTMDLSGNDYSETATIECVKGTGSADRDKALAGVWKGHAEGKKENIICVLTSAGQFAVFDVGEDGTPSSNGKLMGVYETGSEQITLDARDYYSRYYSYLGPAGDEMPQYCKGTYKAEGDLLKLNITEFDLESGLYGDRSFSLILTKQK